MSRRLNARPYRRRSAEPMIVVVALCYGWPVFATLVAVAFACGLRPIEFLTPTRRELLLPDDLLGESSAFFVRVVAPKARWAGARKQYGRCEDYAVLLLVEAVFGPLPKPNRLWPATPCTFRRR